jgi:L,D-transpeptidase ErfK/SrfK
VLFPFLSAMKTRGWWYQFKQVLLIISITLILHVSTVAAKQTTAMASKLVINIPSFTLSLIEGDKVVKRYPVAVGKPSAPTPVGDYKIINKVVNPTWYPPDGSTPVLPGPNNPLGQRWLGFLPTGYGIHGNNNPSSIGKAVSLGCVRMHNADVEELFTLIPVGTELSVTYETIDVETDPITGQTHLVFYPDIYQRQPLTVEVVQDRLGARGIFCTSSDKKIATAILSRQSKPIYVCLGMRVRAAGQEIVVDTEVVNGETLVALRPIVEAFNMPLMWNSERQSVVVGTSELLPYVKAGQSFVHLSDLETHLGIMSYWDSQEQVLELFTWQINVEQVGLLSQGGWLDEDGVWLPAGTIASALEIPLEFESDKTTAIDDSKPWIEKSLGKNVFVLAQTLTEMLPIKVIMFNDIRVVEIMRTN